MATVAVSGICFNQLLTIKNRYTSKDLTSLSLVKEGKNERETKQ